MLAPAEARRAFRGAWLLFRGRSEGLALMDRSFEGFWRSFAALLLVIPSDALMLFVLSRMDGVGSFGTLFMQRLPVLALDFVLLPIGLAAAARPLGIAGGYVDFIVARNWGAPLASALIALPYLLSGAGWLDAQTTTLISVALLGLVFRYQWMTLRLCLRAPIPMAIALLAIDLLMSLLIVGLFSET